MDGIQAAILNVKLPYLKEWTRKRQEVANYYSDSLDDLSEIVFQKHMMMLSMFGICMSYRISREICYKFFKRIMLKQR